MTKKIVLTFVPVYIYVYLLLLSSSHFNTSHPLFKNSLYQIIYLATNTAFAVFHCLLAFTFSNLANHSGTG